MQSILVTGVNSCNNYHHFSWIPTSIFVKEMKQFDNFRLVLYFGKTDNLITVDDVEILKQPSKIERL